MDTLLATLLAWKAVAVGGWFAAVFMAERLAPAAAPPPEARLSGVPGRPWVDAPGWRRLDTPGWRRLARNIAFWLANSVLSLLIVLPLTRWAADTSWAPHWRPLWWAGVGGLLLDLVLLDFLIYWWHRANHRWPLLWRFHDVHHRDEFLDTTSAVRFHSGEVMLSALARAAIIVPLALPLSSVLVFETVVLIGTLFHHSNLRLPAWFERPLALLVITPSIHWVHHHAARRDTDSNYGTIFSFWDRLFASKSATPRRLGMTIGVEGESETTLVALALLPFGKRR